MSLFILQTVQKFAEAVGDALISHYLGYHIWFFIYLFIYYYYYYKSDGLDWVLLNIIVVGYRSSK